MESSTKDAELNKCSITGNTNAVIKSSDEKAINFNKPPGLSKSDVERDILYSSVFNTLYYTEETIPNDHLPYGLICEANPDINSTDWGNEGIEKIASMIYADCANYITKRAVSEGEFEWSHDFILFTNLQIAVYNNFNVIVEGETLDLVVDYAFKNIRNLRSSVARNTILFVECLIKKFPSESPLFSNIFTKLVPQLLSCTASEKVVFREPAKQCLLLLCSKGANILNIEILWSFFDYSYNKNMKISSFSAICIKEYIEQMSDHEFMQIDLERLSQHLEHLLNSKSVQMKEVGNVIIKRLLSVLTHEKIECLRTGEGKPNIVACLNKLSPQKVNVAPY
ncbi:hypothetical protein BEWA_044350 [Theileria equi strain WA]|uniref:Uncharacterized protein n=1 Tax=Theileria equi strain WA TaxID=1537102 RepID=L1LG29_THEEQ|nr:hypothetical protein BEWA_044350 [Theileria equi strain WA]EKX74392.1 hypothetical protein BEWA_044350 [Theileria equi strain WA]|eukprot:XP_004833844.1 hypothetical protein BEWA_044350 [Theileria equi strain WA]